MFTLTEWKQHFVVENQKPKNNRKRKTQVRSFTIISIPIQNCVSLYGHNKYYIKTIRINFKTIIISPKKSSTSVTVVVGSFIFSIIIINFFSVVVVFCLYGFLEFCIDFERKILIIIDIIPPRLLF